MRQCESRSGELRRRRTGTETNQDYVNSRICFSVSRDLPGSAGIVFGLFGRVRPLSSFFLPPSPGRHARHINAPNSNDPSRRPGPMTLKPSPNLHTGHGVVPKQFIIRLQYCFIPNITQLGTASPGKSPKCESYLLTLQLAGFPSCVPATLEAICHLPTLITPAVRRDRFPHLPSAMPKPGQIVAEDCGLSLPDGDDDIRYFLKQYIGPTSPYHLEEGTSGNRIA